MVVKPLLGLVRFRPGNRFEIPHRHHITLRYLCYRTLFSVKFGDPFLPLLSRIDRRLFVRVLESNNNNKDVILPYSVVLLGHRLKMSKGGN